jgi:XRE family transcriptional regulator, regulator of sulfur utilization
MASRLLSRFHKTVPAIEKVRKSIGINIRSCRIKAGLTQEKLAEKADLHPVYISQVESGLKAISVEALWKISRALRIPVARLFRGI